MHLCHGWIQHSVKETVCTQVLSVAWVLVKSITSPKGKSTIFFLFYMCKINCNIQQKCKTRCVVKTQMPPPPKKNTCPYWWNTYQDIWYIFTISIFWTFHSQNPGAEKFAISVHPFLSFFLNMYLAITQYHGNNVFSDTRYWLINELKIECLRHDTDISSRFPFRSQPGTKSLFWDHEIYSLRK